MSLIPLRIRLRTTTYLRSITIASQSYLPITRRSSYGIKLVISQARHMSEKVAVLTDKAPRPAGPYNQGIKANGLVFVSGQIPANPGGEFSHEIQDATAQCLNNVKAILEAAGSSLSKVVKTTVYLADMGDFKKMNEVYAKFFDEAGAPAPARACIAAKELPLGVRVEIDAIALE